jgi:hypothetical protein
MQPGSDSAVSQFDKDDVEAIGLVKFDFLGLATLTILELAKDFIRARHADQHDFSFEALALNDPGAYRLMSEGKTVAVFQLESSGMQRMLRDAKPSVFEDVIALVAVELMPSWEIAVAVCNELFVIVTPVAPETAALIPRAPIPLVESATVEVVASVTEPVVEVSAELTDRFEAAKPAAVEVAVMLRSPHAVIGEVDR